MVLMFNTREFPGPNEVPLLLPTVFSSIAITVMMCMPMRDPRLPVDDISPVFGKPTQIRRTPEDNLTILQFMTVIWMSPLIALGKKRQLHGEDVWDLGYEFKHKRLHENFRQLKGSVIKRLLVANGIDLILVSLLEALSLFASMACLQKLPNTY